MSFTRLVIAPAAPDAAPDYLIVDAMGAILERGVLPIADPSAVTPMRTVLVAPGADAAARWIHLPARNEDQARAAAAMVLEDQLAGGTEDLHVAAGPLEADGHRLVVAVDRTRLRSWLDGAALHGLRPDVVVPDHLALPPPEDEGVVAAPFGETVAARGERLALSVEPDLLPVVLGDRPARELTAFERDRLLAQAVHAPPINLLQGEFDPARSVRLERRDLTRAGVLLAAVLASPLLLMAATALRYELAADAARREAAAQVQTLTGAPAGEDPLGAAQARLLQAEASAGGGPAAVAAALYTAVEGVDQAQFESFVVMPDGSARASVSLASFQDAERLRQALRQAGLASREEGVREEGERVVADLILGARG